MLLRVIASGGRTGNCLAPYGPSTLVTMNLSVAVATCGGEVWLIPALSDEEKITDRAFVGNSPSLLCTGVDGSGLTALVALVGAGG